VAGIFLSIYRLPSLLVVSVLLLGSAVTSRAETVHRTGKIAFASNREGNFEIYTINSDGSDQVRLTNNPGVDNYPAWSPDGTMIAFIRATPEGGLAIFRMNEDGTNETQITPINSIRAPLSWSPDGGRIAFQDRDSASKLRIFVVNSDGSNRRTVTNDSAASDTDPSWSPDGSRILF
jgi:Tol biopolymer transport system component